MNADQSPRAVVRIDRETNPFEALGVQERLRLMVRVLCELVAYGELDEATTVSAPQASEPIAASG